MSEPLAEHLSRFTPDAAGLNRDALLFAAGRASVWPSRRWQVLAGILALSQVMTLALLWPRTPPPAPLPVPAVVESPAPMIAPKESLPETPPPDGTWCAGMVSRDLERAEPFLDEPTAPSAPPLRAFGPPPASILN